jgi:type I pantothenate kinase
MPEMGSRGANNEHTTPFVEIPRSYWADLAPSTTLPLTPTEIVELSGLGEMLSLREVSEVYLPLSKLLTLYAVGAQQLHRSTSSFLKRPSDGTPFVIGVAGSVAVGKSTISRLLRELLSRWEDTPRVELLTTDGFLLPNAELERRGLMERKGFPESYDRRALLRFVSKVKSGAAEVRAPFYSHLSYDISPGAEVVIRQPDILIVEGLNVLQPPAVRSDGSSTGAISDYFDFSVYVDAPVEEIRTWYVERFLRLRETAFADPQSYFHRYARLSDDEARETAAAIWEQINEPNLVENVLPTRDRATLVLTKGADHAVTGIRLRKI